MNKNTLLIVGAAVFALYMYKRYMSKMNQPIKKLTTEQQKSVTDIVNTAKSVRLI